MGDHNDPNAVNSIFSDIDVSAADLYDIFGFPTTDGSGTDRVVIALTFAAVPQTNWRATASSIPTRSFHDGATASKKLPAGPLT
jgi:FAD/FMN-containing dehydrogenase